MTSSHLNSLLYTLDSLLSGVGINAATGAVGCFRGAVEAGHKGYVNPHHEESLQAVVALRPQVGGVIKAVQVSRSRSTGPDLGQVQV